MKDDNDRYLEGTLPTDPFADTEQIDVTTANGEDAENPDWGDPLPIGPTADVPSFPVEVLPGWLRNWVVALADALQCPVDLPAMLALAVLSLSCAKKFSVRVRPDWDEPINVYIAVALKPGESKSPAFAAVTRPVSRFVAEEQRRQDPEIRAAIARADVAVKHIEQLKGRAAKTIDPAARGKLLAQIEEAVFEQGTIQVPVPLRLILDDVTAESLEVVLRKQGGRISILSDEGGPFELMGGRYSDGIPNIDIYLKGHSGSPISTDRISREGGSVRNPAITIGLAIQPDVLTSLQDKKGFRGRGLLARFLWSIPRSRVGSRAADSPPVPADVRDSYDLAVTALLEIEARKDELGEIEPRTIDLNKEAYALLVEFKDAIEPALGPSGELESIADWGNKLAGTVVRLAGLLHLADRFGEASERMVEPIGQGEMRRAMRIADFLCAHARIAFDLMNSDPIARGARHILAWIQRTNAESFTLREVYLPLRARFRAPAELDEPLDLLIDHEVIRRRPDPPRSGPGRRPSPVFDVNPVIYAQNAQNSAPGPSAGDSAHSERRSGSSALGSQVGCEPTKGATTEGECDARDAQSHAQDSVTGSAPGNYVHSERPSELPASHSPVGTGTTEHDVTGGD